MNAGYEMSTLAKIVIVVVALVGLFVIAAYPKVAGWIKGLFGRKG